MALTIAISGLPHGLNRGSPQNSEKIAP